MITDEESFINILEKTIIGNIIESCSNVYRIIREYGEISQNDFVDGINEVIIQTIADTSYSEFINYFDETELLEEIVTYRMKIDPYDFVSIFKDYTDRTNSEIRDFINYHCDVFGENPDRYYKYL